MRKEYEPIDFRPYKDCLEDKAFKLENSLGRRDPAGDDDDGALFGVVDDLTIDYRKIVSSKAFRRLQYKTQVFPNPENINVRNRATHSAGISGSAVIDAKIMGLNSDLVLAGSWLHDTGHVVFGHLGERFLNEYYPTEFRHEAFSVIVAQKIERKGRGLNLLYETLEIGLYHSRGGGCLNPDPLRTQECNLAMYHDKLDYTFNDANDCLRTGYLKLSEMPEVFFELGSNQRERMERCEYALIKESAEKGYVSFTDSETAQKFESFRQWMYDRVYLKLDYEKDRLYIHDTLERVYRWLKDYPFLGTDPLLAIALMGDREVLLLSEMIDGFSIGDLEKIKKMSFVEIILNLPPVEKFDFSDLGLEWAELRKKH